MIEVNYDGIVIQQRCLLVSVMNGHRLGGGFLMAPHADPSDGWLDLCLVSDVSKARIFTLIPHFFRGTQATQPEVKTGRAKHVLINALEGTLPVQTDGEILCIDGQQIEVRIHSQKIDVITNRTTVSF